MNHQQTSTVVLQKQVHYPLWTALCLVTRGWDGIPYRPSWRIIFAETIFSSLLLLSMNKAIKIFLKTSRKMPETSQLQKLSSAVSAVQQNVVEGF